MRDFKGDLSAAGYNLEEAYFHKLNRELIEKIKQKQKRSHLKLVHSSETTEKEKTEQQSAREQNTGSERQKKAA